MIVDKNCGIPACFSEWKLAKKVFKQIAISCGKPSINLFGSSINEQLSNDIDWT